MSAATARECHCLLCSNGRSSESAWPERERRNARLVREYGWGVTGVLGLTRPDWAYSIGLWHSYGSVEVCLLGIAQQPAMRIVNAVGDLIRDGLVLLPDMRLADVLDDGELALAPVHSTWYESLFGAAIDYYQQPPFPVVQLLWADEAGRYPGHPEREPGQANQQPCLWMPMEEHPPCIWTST